MPGTQLPLYLNLQSRCTEVGHCTQLIVFTPWEMTILKYLLISRHKAIFCWGLKRPSWFKAPRVSIRQGFTSQCYTALTYLGSLRKEVGKGFGVDGCKQHLFQCMWPFGGVFFLPLLFAIFETLRFFSTVRFFSKNSWNGSINSGIFCKSLATCPFVWINIVLCFCIQFSCLFSGTPSLTFLYSSFIHGTILSP